MGGGRSLRGGPRGSDILSDSAAAIATRREAATTNCRAGAERIDAGGSGESRRAASEGEIILGFGKQRWIVGGFDGRVAALERPRAAFETSIEHIAGWTCGCRTAHAAARRSAFGLLFAAERNCDCGFFRGAGDGDTFGDSERATGRGFHYANTGSECAGRAAAEDLDSWAGSRNARGAFGLNRDIPGEHEGSAGGACCRGSRSSASISAKRGQACSPRDGETCAGRGSGNETWFFAWR